MNSSRTPKLPDFRSKLPHPLLLFNPTRRPRSGPYQCFRLRENSVEVKQIEIKNGELGDWYKGVGITGKTLEFLSNVDAVGNDFDVRGSGCGKGHEDYVPVSSGGPHMRIRNAIIG